MTKEDYLKLAKKQFYALKEETLAEDRHLVGAGNDIDYDIDGNKFTISVSGCWEKATWFDWVVFDDKGSELHRDTKYC